MVNTFRDFRAFSSNGESVLASRQNSYFIQSLGIGWQSFITCKPFIEPFFTGNWQENVARDRDFVDFFYTIFSLSGNLPFLAATAF